MQVIVGLGNPGLEYRQTRHNAGYMALEDLGTDDGAHFSHKRDLKADVAKCSLAGKPVLLVKPTTYMNLSGQAVQAVLHWYKIEPDKMLVVHDDVSLPLGKLRMQVAGGAGGQHGVESIIEHLSGRKTFDRLKIGVGPDPGGDIRGDFVLSPFHPSERDLYDKCLEAARTIIKLWVTDGAREAMNRYNGINLAPAPEPLAEAPAPDPLRETPKP